jgi:hypothetical protein
VRYELYLRTGEDVAARGALSWDAVRDALALAGVETTQGLPAELDLGQGRLRFEAYRRTLEGGPAGRAPTGEVPATETPAGEAPALDGLNASFPLGLQDSQGDRATAAVLRVAEQLGWVMFDPQLGCLVTKADHGRILTAWRRAYEFHLGVVGAAELGAGAPAPAQPERGGLSSKFKLVLWLALGLVMASFLFRACFDRWMERQWDPPVPGQVESMAPDAEAPR